MAQMKTPGVYVVEKNAFPNSVVQVATAVPAFIGHTEKADNGGKSLTNTAWKITSMAEYFSYFGGAPIPTFSITEAKKQATAAGGEAGGEAGGGAAPEKKEEGATPKPFALSDYDIKQANTPYLMYFSMLHFFQNGGGPCYIVSIGDYEKDLEADSFSAGIDLLIKEQEPTMLVMPEIVKLGSDSDCFKIQQHALMHCGDKMQSRVALLDVYNGYLDREDKDGDVVEKFREGLGINFLNWGASYYPWINTSIIDDSSLSFHNIDKGSIDTLSTILANELTSPIDVQVAALTAEEDGAVKNKAKIDKLNAVKKQYDDLIAKMKAEYDLTKSAQRNDFEASNKALIKLSPALNQILTEVKNQINLMPPTPAMAGIYTLTDNSRGVWKAPANVSVNSAISPSVNINNYDQEDLNVPLSGKAVNAIRAFIGEGTLVWGARTLDGNSQDWRYISVRRTMIMLEQSIKIATKAYVFEPNVANTWVTIKSMISNFLNGIWKQGGLAGASPEDAFSVHVGLGETMTPNDILDGIMRVTVLVAISRPAEFIEITFQQQMQKS